MKRYYVIGLFLLLVSLVSAEELVLDLPSWLVEDVSVSETYKFIDDFLYELKDANRKQYSKVKENVPLIDNPREDYYNAREYIYKHGLLELGQLDQRRAIEQFFFQHITSEDHRLSTTSIAFFSRLSGKVSAEMKKALNEIANDTSGDLEYPYRLYKSRLKIPCEIQFSEKTLIALHGFVYESLPKSKDDSFFIEIGEKLITSSKYLKKLTSMMISRLNDLEGNSSQVDYTKGLWWIARSIKNREIQAEIFKSIVGALLKKEKMDYYSIKDFASNARLWGGFYVVNENEVNQILENISETNNQYIKSILVRMCSMKGDERLAEICLDLMKKEDPVGIVWHSSVQYFNNRKDLRIISQIVDGIAQSDFSLSGLIDYKTGQPVEGAGFPNSAQKRMIYILQNLTGEKLFGKDPESTKMNVIKWWEQNDSNPKYNFK